MFRSFHFLSFSLTSNHEGYIVGMHPLLILLIGMGIGAFLCLVLLAFYLYKKEEKTKQEVEKITQQFLRDRIQTEALLEDLDLGVIVYGIDGKLKLSNQRVLAMLNLKHVPDHINDFLVLYDEANDLKTAQLLGALETHADIEINKRQIHITMKDIAMEGKSNFSTLFITSDITANVLEEKQRKEFVANVSHELRTPLTIIKTYTESLLDWGVDEKKTESIKQDLTRILEDSNRMEALINDLLLLSSIDSRGKGMHMDEIDLVSIVKSAVERCQLKAEEKEIELTCDVMSNIPKVFGDRSSMDRILLNMILNAIKYTDKKGKVNVYLSRVAEDITVKVKDNGKGIEERHLQSIFDRFYRVDNTGSRKYGGTGLGLSIAKELCELHHGKISVQSVLTKGSEFTVSLPSAAKIYRKIMLEVELADGQEGDILIAKARQFLLDEAASLGIEKNSLQDLTRQERDIILAPYKIQSDEDEEERVEDFAGVLSSERQVPSNALAEDEMSTENTTIDNPLEKEENELPSHGKINAINNEE